jgi:hypothetical protein
MNPHVMQALAGQHAHELRLRARQHRLRAACPSPSAVRYRAGWALVAIGLRLAATSGWPDHGRVRWREFARGPG